MNAKLTKRRVQHAARLLWLAIRYRKPWIYYDGWKGVVAKGPGGTPETNPFLFFHLSKEASGLPVDLFVLNGDAYLDTNAPAMILFYNGYDTYAFQDLIPLSISTIPRILVRRHQTMLDERDLETIRTFVQEQKTTLLNLANNPPSIDRIVRFLRQLKKNA